ncbi:hypothetical protein BGZ94_000778 [Podila epigama]|nr:hypothetical protein BGZ94_000778 [Podila epigama]
MSAAAPKSGRLVVLSIKQSKKGDKRTRKFELDLRWAMAMSAPVFAISPFMEMKLLVSNGPMLKLLALDLEKKTLVERAGYRERWPIFQISTQGSMICTGSRREGISFYEYRVDENSGDVSTAERVVFLKSSPSARMVADCLAISPEFAVGTDLSGGIFGIGYSKDDPSCQHSLVERFSFYVGEVMHRIRLAKTWPSEERSLAGITLSQRVDERKSGENDMDTTTNGGGHGDGAIALSQATQSTLTEPSKNVLSSGGQASDGGGGGGTLQLGGVPASSLWIVRPWMPSKMLAATPRFHLTAPITDEDMAIVATRQGFTSMTTLETSTTTAATTTTTTTTTVTSITATSTGATTSGATTMTTSSSLSQSETTKLPLPSTQALVASTLTGGVYGFWLLDKRVYQILTTLQEQLQVSEICRPLLGNQHSHFRSLSAPVLSTVDGDLLERFLELDHGQQVEAVERSVGLVRWVDEWVASRGLSNVLSDILCCPLEAPQELEQQQQHQQQQQQQNLGQPPKPRACQHGQAEFAKLMVKNKTRIKA